MTPTTDRRKQTSRLTPPVIALLTDFGLTDHFVATMKGVILGTNPSAAIVDISHGVVPQQVSQARYLLWSSYRYFPPGTIFVCVVDPGVGTDRRILIAEVDKRIFLAPDNGLLDLIFAENSKGTLVELRFDRARKYMLEEMSSTFHGRDIFAPLAAHISRGLKIQDLGVRSEWRQVSSPFVRVREDVTKPSVVHIDRFGNVVTNIAVPSIEKAMQQFSLITVGTSMVTTWVRSFGEAPDKTPALLCSSRGLIEVVVKNESAATLLSANLFTPIRVYWK